MDILKRRHAPILPEAWEQIDEEARRVLKLHLAGRKVVDFSGPHGWKFAAVNTGRLKLLERGPVAGVPSGVRDVRPLVELRLPFFLEIMELDYAARGATDLDLDALIAAAERIALAEDTSIFHGYAPGGITGIIPASPHAPLTVNASQEWPAVIARAKEVLRAAGVNGPYVLALGAKSFDEISADSEDGYPLRKRIEQNLVDDVIWAPALAEGGVLLSARGGDFELTVGGDFSIGYTAHDREKVELYITESFTFRVLEEKAAILIRRT